MKLYTEEQVREAFNAGFRIAMETDGGLNEYRALFINALTPIELPSDEEIHKQSTNYSSLYYEFRAGAQWVIEQIQNQQK